MGKHWIILVNRSPRGPLSFDEVNALLSDKIISRTDLALQVLEDPNHKASWKFLWQYPEFDLRTQTPNEVTSTQPPPIDRRKTAQPQEVEKKIATLLADDIALINPEDLILTAKKNRSKGPIDGALEGLNTQNELENSSGDRFQGGGVKWGLSFLGISTLVAGFYFKSVFFSGEIPKSPATKVSQKGPPSQKLPLRLPTQQSPILNAGPSQTADPNFAVSKPLVQEKKEPPKLPAPGIITIEDYQKLKELNAEKERKEEDEKRQAIEEAEEVAESSGEGENSTGDEVSSDESEGAETQGTSKRSKKRKSVSAKAKRKLAEEVEEQTGEKEQAHSEGEPQED